MDGNPSASSACIVEWVALQAFNRYRFLANCKPAALGLLKTLQHHNMILLG